jgi:hypothetical protein
MYQQRRALLLITDNPSDPVGAHGTAGQKEEQHVRTDNGRRDDQFEHLTADFKIPSSDLSGRSL